jgi:hypothetical protein
MLSSRLLGPVREDDAFFSDDELEDREALKDPLQATLQPEGDHHLPRLLTVGCSAANSLLPGELPSHLCGTRFGWPTRPPSQRERIHSRAGWRRQIVAAELAALCDPWKES